MNSAVLATSQLLRLASEHHQAGRSLQAKAIYRKILRVEPDHPDALHLLGMLAFESGQTDTAVCLINKAIRADPSKASYYSNLGNVLQKQGKLEQAVCAYRKAISLRPNYAVAHFNLGNAYQAQDNLDEAVACFQEALLFDPNLADAHNNLGIIFLLRGRFKDSITAYREAISLRPNYAAALFNLGNAYKSQYKLYEAAACFKKVLLIEPNFADAHHNLGIVFLLLGRFKDAITAYGNAISFKPDYAEAFNNIGEVLREQDKLEEAVAFYGKALLLKPDYVNAFSNLLYLHASTRDISPEAECRLAAKWEQCALGEAERAAALNRGFVRLPRTGRKLRVGIVSAEIGDHAVADFLEPFLEQLDHTRFHLTLFPSTMMPGVRASRILALADDCKPLVGFSDAKAADLIRSAAMDILMDTTGHTRDCRLGIFAHRAAPVQVTYIGYWSTTGLTEMDWIISDAYVPLSFDSHFLEGVWRLPRLAVCYRGDHSLPGSRWKPATDGTVWLGSFNRYSKIREATLSLWAKVMKAIPESKLLLEDRAVEDSDTHDRILTSLNRNGVSGERIEFEHFVSGHERHMVLYDRLDIALDTIPFNSGTTACDALWMGAPLVALEGNWVGGTIASNFLKALGRPEWIAESEDAYVSIVARLARDIEGRKALRSAQRSLMASSPICDSKGLAMALEEALEKMFDLYQAKGVAGRCSDLPPVPGKTPLCTRL